MGDVITIEAATLLELFAKIEETTKDRSSIKFVDEIGGGTDWASGSAGVYSSGFNPIWDAKEKKWACCIDMGHSISEKRAKAAKKAAKTRAKNKAKKEAQANETAELEKKIADAVAAEDYKAAAELKEKLEKRKRQWASGYD